MKMSNSADLPHIILQYGSKQILLAIRDAISEKHMSILMDTFLVGFGITAYVAAHAYAVLVLKAPAEKHAFELAQRRA